MVREVSVDFNVHYTHASALESHKTLSNTESNRLQEGK